MKFTPTKSSDGGFSINIEMTKEELDNYGEGFITQAFWDKTDYCVTCHDNFGKEYKYTIECLGDIAANIEAAITCTKEVGNPSYALSKGKC